MIYLNIILKETNGGDKNHQQERDQLSCDEPNINQPQIRGWADAEWAHRICAQMRGEGDSWSLEPDNRGIGDSMN